MAGPALETLWAGLATDLTNTPAAQPIPLAAPATPAADTNGGGGGGFSSGGEQAPPASPPPMAAPPTSTASQDATMASLAGAALTPLPPVDTTAGGSAAPSDAAFQPADAGANALLTPAAPPAVQVSGLYNTGLDANAHLLNQGGPDAHYALVSRPAGATAGAPRTFRDGFPLPALGPYEANGTDSQWVSPNSDGTYSEPDGDYVYQATFDLAGDLSGFHLDGRWATDNGGVDIFVNGVSVGATTPSADFHFHPFSITAGLEEGGNTVRFVVHNDPLVGGMNPTALRVEWDLATPVAPPPPVTPLSTLFNTGVDGARQMVGDGALDSHWQLLVSPDPSYQGPQASVLNDAWPIGPNGPWAANGPDVRWVTPHADDAGNALPGDYTYRTTFDLAGYDPSNVTVSGTWATDNDGVDILVNGQSTGHTTPFADFQPHAFTISAGFVSGVNTLDFVVHNGGDSANPTGLRVRFDQPAPATLATVTGSVWGDGGDGLRQSSESGEPATVKLWNLATNKAITTATDGLGNYTFAGVLAGQYQVEVLPNDIGRPFAPRFQGQDPALDSDVDRNGLTDQFVLSPGEVLANVAAGIVLRAAPPPALLVEFQAEKSMGLESVAAPTINVVLSAPSNNVVTVDYKVVQPVKPAEPQYWATGGDDFNSMAGTITFQPGETVHALENFRVVNDATQELNENVRFVLENVQNADIGANSEHLYTIVDDDGGLYAAKKANGGNWANVKAAFGFDGAGVNVGVIEYADTSNDPLGIDPDKNHLAHLGVDQSFVGVTEAPLNLNRPKPPAPNKAAHATLVADVVAGGDPYHTGVAPGATVNVAYVTSDGDKETEIRAAEDFYNRRYGVGLFNHSYKITEPKNAGTSTLVTFLDWFSSARDVLNVVSAGNSRETVEVPGDLFNGITVGATDRSFQARASYSAYLVGTEEGKNDFPEDVRGKPDILAFGGDNVQEVSSGTLKATGTSFAAPQVTGVAAILSEAGLPLGKAGNANGCIPKKRSCVC